MWCYIYVVYMILILNHYSSLPDLLTCLAEEKLCSALINARRLFWLDCLTAEWLQRRADIITSFISHWVTGCCHVQSGWADSAPAWKEVDGATWRTTHIAKDLWYVYCICRNCMKNNTVTLLCDVWIVCVVKQTNWRQQHRVILKWIWTNKKTFRCKSALMSWFVHVRP